MSVRKGFKLAFAGALLVVGCIGLFATLFMSRGRIYPPSLHDPGIYTAMTLLGGGTLAIVIGVETYRKFFRR